jgi:hypothetical protein
MQRVLGYLFFLVLVVMAAVSLRDRFQAGSTINPFGEDPDWIGILLIVAATGCGVWLLVVREGRDTRRRKEGIDNGDHDKS